MKTGYCFGWLNPKQKANSYWNLVKREIRHYSFKWSKLLRNKFYCPDDYFGKLQENPPGDFLWVLSWRVTYFRLSKRLLVSLRNAFPHFNINHVNQEIRAYANCHNSIMYQHHLSGSRSHIAYIRDWWALRWYFWPSTVIIWSILQPGQVPLSDAKSYQNDGQETQCASGFLQSRCISRSTMEGKTRNWPDDHDGGESILWLCILPLFFSIKVMFL